MTGLRCKLVLLFPLFSSSRTSNRWDAQVSRRVKKSMLMLSRYFITPPTFFFFPEGGHNGPLTRAFQITAFWRHCCVPLFPCSFFFWLLPWINAAEIYLSIGHRRRWGQLVPRKLLIIHERTGGGSWTWDTKRDDVMFLLRDTIDAEYLMISILMASNWWTGTIVMISIKHWRFPPCGTRNWSLVWLNLNEINLIRM